MCQKCVEAGEMTQAEADQQAELLGNLLEGDSDGGLGGAGLLAALLMGGLGGSPEFDGENVTPSVILMQQTAAAYPDLGLETNKDFIDFVNDAEQFVGDDPIMNAVFHATRNTIGAVFSYDDKIADMIKNKPEGMPDELANMMMQKVFDHAHQSVAVGINMFGLLKQTIDIKQGVVPEGTVTH